MLSGRTILVTRPARQAAGLVEPLEGVGATVVTLPAIAIAPPEDLREFDSALFDLSRFGWLVFTSVNGVEAVRERMDALGLDRRAKGRTRIAAVGPATAEAVRSAFYEPDAVPETYVSEAVADAMGEVRGQRIMLARADIARKELPALLSDRGGIVEEVRAYRIVRPEADAPLPERAPDWIVLTSSSAVHGTRDALEAQGKGDWMRSARLACIGPITAATVRELGYEVALMPSEYTIPALVEALARSESPTLPRERGRGEGHSVEMSALDASTPSTWKATPAAEPSGSASPPLTPDPSPPEERGEVSYA